MDNETVTIIKDALTPLGEWLLILGGLGITIAIALHAVQWAWDLFRDLAGGGVNLSDYNYGAHYDDHNDDEAGRYRW
jgi:hypothetical protein